MEDRDGKSLICKGNFNFDLMFDQKFRSIKELQLINCCQMWMDSMNNSERRLWISCVIEVNTVFEVKDSNWFRLLLVETIGDELSFSCWKWTVPSANTSFITVRLSKRPGFIQSVLYHIIGGKSTQNKRTCYIPTSLYHPELRCRENCCTHFSGLHIYQLFRLLITMRL